MTPWDYQVCAAIPVIGSLDAVKVCIDTLRRQTERPYILLIETGSANFDSLRADDCEVHTIRLGDGLGILALPVTVSARDACRLLHQAA